MIWHVLKQTNKNLTIERETPLIIIYVTFQRKTKKNGLKLIPLSVNISISM